jgi:hypothetical protein
MLSKLRNVFMPVASRGRLASILAVLALLVPATAGCGGGGEDGKATTDGKTTTGQKDGKAGNKPKTPRGGVIRSFEIKVASATRATITTTLTKASPLALQVKKLSGSQKLKIGKVNLGSKPAGASTINWNLTAAGKKLTPGRYRVVLRAGKMAGKSAPKIITVPGG